MAKAAKSKAGDRKTIVIKSERHVMYGSVHNITPVGAEGRRQQICNSGIFNLMGINAPGTYVIECVKVAD